MAVFHHTRLSLDAQRIDECWNNKIYIINVPFKGNFAERNIKHKAYMLN